MLNLETIHWHTLCADYLNENSKVLDLGGNYGLFAAAVTERFKCKCVTVEPAPIPFNAIKTGPHVSKIQAAVGATGGSMGFRVDSNSVASALSEGGDIQVEVKTLPQVTSEIGWNRIDLLKVDIEGEEIAMLESCSDDFLKKRIVQISVEFHDFCGITPASVVQDSLNRLSSLGFAHVRMSRIGHQDTWLINRNLCKVTNIELMIARNITRNWFGFKRVATRMISSR